MAGTFLPYLVAFAWLSLFILVGVFLRAKVKLFQVTLLPSSIIAGVIGFIFINLGWIVVPTPTGWETLKPGTFGVMTFHLFAIGFVGIGLLRSSDKEHSAERVKAFWRGSYWIAVVFMFSYAVQSLIGYSIFEGWRTFVGGDTNSIIGYLFGTGFTQGPGQTLAYASIWESPPHSVQNAINIGLTFAAVGFFASAVVGVPLARYGLRRGWATLKTNQELPQEFLTGIMADGNQPSCARAVTHPANIDTFAYHMSIIFFIYGLAYVFGIWWMRVMPTSIAPLGIGLMFFWGMCVAKMARFGASKFSLDHYFDEETIRRYTGLSVDLMVASVFMSIELKAIQGMLIPIIVTILVGTAATLFMIVWLGRRSPELGFERILVTFGTCTGTVATGLLLLRIADPDFRTSVAEEVGMMNFVSTIIGAPVMYFGLPFAAIAGYPMNWIFLGTIIAMPILLIVPRLIRKPQF